MEELFTSPLRILALMLIIIIMIVYVATDIDDDMI